MCMNKLLVEIYVPSIGSVYDVIIPYKARVFEITHLITYAVEKLSNGLFVAKDVALCDWVSGSIYDNNMSVEDMSLRNGSRLMLI